MIVIHLQSPNRLKIEIYALFMTLNANFFLNLTWPGLYHGARGETEYELNTLFKSISMLVSRSNYRGSNFRVSPDFLKCMIDKNWTGDACSIEHASVLYHICCCFLKCMDKNDTRYYHTSRFFL